MLIGYEEARIYTPPLRELTPETTFGFLFIEFVENVVHGTLLPWDRWLAIHIFEIIGDMDGDWRFRFRKVIVLVARQNGKTFLSAYIVLFFIYILQAKRVLGTSANLDKAEEVWRRVLVEIEGDDDFGIEPNDELMADFVDKRLGNGKLDMWFRDGQHYKVAAVGGVSKTKGGRGDSNDLVMLDEFREHRSWDAWRATTKSTNARPRGMVLCLTNAGDIESVPLRALRIKAHARLGDPDGVVAAMGDLAPQVPSGEDADDTLGWFEWSAPPRCSIFDRDGWAHSNPSLGHGFIEERAIMSDAQSDDEIGFRTEVLCQFVDTLAEKTFPGDSWERGVDEDSEIAEGAKVYIGVDLSVDKTTTSAAVCGRRADGRWHIEVIEHKLGTDWLLRWLTDIADPLAPIDVAWQKNGAPISALGDQIKAIPGVITHEIAGSALYESFDRFWMGIAASDSESQHDATRIMHRPQPFLDEAAKIVVTKRKGDGGSSLMDRSESPGNVAPLIACVMAHAVATTPVEVEQPKVAPSAYADGHDVLII